MELVSPLWSTSHLLQTLIYCCSDVNRFQPFNSAAFEKPWTLPSWHRGTIWWKSRRTSGTMGIFKPICCVRTGLCHPRRLRARFDHAASTSVGLCGATSISDCWGHKEMRGQINSLVICHAVKAPFTPALLSSASPMTIECVSVMSFAQRYMMAICPSRD